MLGCNLVHNLKDTHGTGRRTETITAYPMKTAYAMKTIVYPDGSIESTVRADEFVARGLARFATPKEIRGYERAFEQSDESWERMAMEGDSGPSQPSCDY